MTDRSSARGRTKKTRATTSRSTLWENKNLSEDEQKLKRRQSKKSQILTGTPQNAKQNFPLKSSKITTDPRRSLPSLPHLIETRKTSSWLTPKLEM
jgi:hypothetical protein